MRDVEEGQAPLLQLPHTLEETLDLVDLELCGGFIKNDEASPLRKCSRDLEDLALFDRKLFGWPVNVEIEAPVTENCSGS